MRTPADLRRLKRAATLALLPLLLLGPALRAPAPVFAASGWSPALLVNTEAFQSIDDTDSASNVVLRFGENLNRTITYDRTAGYFAFNDDIAVSAAAIALFPAAAFAQSFSDVKPDHPAYAAVEFLRSRSILQGYADGTFKPNQQVNRAEAVKILVAQMVSADKLPSGVSVYGDVAADAWFAPYIEVARTQLGIIDGPPKSSAFNPTKPVKKVEFLKMLFLAQKIDTAGSYAEIRRPLAQDVPNPDEWYYPHMRYAMSASMLIVAQDGMLSPAKELTRADIATLLYHFMMYREGRRTQALLSLTESEIINVLQALENGAGAQAQFAAARSLLAARGALASAPDQAVVKGALKTAEGFQALVDANRAGSEGRLQDAIDLSKKAWDLAEKAKEFSPSLEKVATQMQTIASGMAAEARRLQAGGQ